MRPVERQTSLEEFPEAERRPWYYKLGIVLFIIVTFEVGLFLMLFPWMPQWRINRIATAARWMSDVWNSPYFRGALSGLGIINIYISLAEVIRLRRPRADRLKMRPL